MGFLNSVDFHFIHLTIIRHFAPLFSSSVNRTLWSFHLVSQRKMTPALQSPAWA